MLSVYTFKQKYMALFDWLVGANPGVGKGESIKGEVVDIVKYKFVQEM